jgi:tetratricopeptide (TPR) repeat protein
MNSNIFFGLIGVVALASCTSPKNETAARVPAVISLTGEKFFEPVRSPEVQARLDSNLLAAKRNFEADPSEENYIWYGRREAYLSRFQRAVDLFSEGLERYPGSFRLYRHRGHRYITLRKFDEAIADLEKAATLMQGAPIETEPDGQPNRLNQPLSNTQFNVWYHLGLAYYLKGDWEKAIAAYKECWEVSLNDDLKVATADWLYMALRRAGKVEQAANVLAMLPASPNIMENDSYYRRLQLYAGKITPEQVLSVNGSAADRDLAVATQGYGVGNWYLYQGNPAKAREIFQQVVRGPQFAAFGFIAAEAELSRD